MRPMLVHHCTACNFNTPVAFSASVSSQDQYCNHCTARSQGVVLRVPAVESSLSKELAAPPKDMQEEELSRLFGQSLNFAPRPSNPTPPPDAAAAAVHPHPHPLPEPQAASLSPPAQEPRRASSEPLTYASAHYTHSAHVTRPREASPPLSTSSHLERSDLERLLLAHGVDPSLLFPSQLTLFQNADPGQRLRLLELWRISPPTYAEHEAVWESGVWPETDLQREEALARQRYERLMGARAAHHSGGEWDGMLVEHGDDASASASSYTHAPRAAEPYMQSGYEALSHRGHDPAAAMQSGHMPLQESTRYNQATDPAYYKAGQQEMENQYGLYQAARQTEAVTPMDDEMTM